MPFCLRAMGAHVTVVTPLPSDLDAQTQDFVMMDDRDPGRSLTKAQRSSGKLVNVAWLKACLVAGVSLPAAVMRH